MDESTIVERSDLILVTGANGFIGRRVMVELARRGFRNLRCVVRPPGNASMVRQLAAEHPGASFDVVEGNLLSGDVCQRALSGVRIVYHVAAGIDKSFAGAFMNSVLTTRNLLDAARRDGRLRRFVNVSSFAVYSGANVRWGGVLDESTPVEANPAARGDAYAFGKIRQDELVLEFGRAVDADVVIVRPGAVIGPGRTGITGRVGIGTFGIYLHLGGSNPVPFTYVDNCAEAIVLAGLVPQAAGQVFNVVDDDLPSSREFLRLYKRHVRRFRSVYVPYVASYALCVLWENYSRWSQGQLPPVFNRRRAQAEWRPKVFSNRRLKEVLGWTPRVPMGEALKRYFAYARENAANSDNA